jgi:hypothetical protein
LNGTIPDEPDFETMLGDALDVIDRELADNGIALSNRPLTAARHFVRYFVLQVSDGTSAEPFEPGEFNEYWASEWFKVVYARTVAWYAGRYGKAMKQETERTFPGCILVLGTAFLLRVPVVTHRPGKPGETIWVCYPDRVEKDEDALAWIENGPNRAALPRGDGLKARRLANEVATHLRAITVSLATVTAGNKRVAQLRDQILTHLDGAAIKIVRGRPEDLKHAQWDMQMACELALKMLAQQRGGSFAESHDLYHLYDQLPPGTPPFDRSRLTQIPKWERMAEWRYGGGPTILTATAFSRYRAMLKIVLGVGEVAERKYRIGGASFEIRRAPFLHDDPAMFEPKSRQPAEA